jgi:hypothetical protein
MTQSPHNRLAELHISAHELTKQAHELSMNAHRYAEQQFTASSGFQKK